MVYRLPVTAVNLGKKGYFLPRFPPPIQHGRTRSTSPTTTIIILTAVYHSKFTERLRFTVLYTEVNLPSGKLQLLQLKNGGKKVTITAAPLDTLFKGGFKKSGSFGWCPPTQLLGNLFVFDSIRSRSLQNV